MLIILIIAMMELTTAGAQLIIREAYIMETFAMGTYLIITGDYTENVMCRP